LSFPTAGGSNAASKTSGIIWDFYYGCTDRPIDWLIDLRAIQLHHYCSKAAGYSFNPCIYELIGSYLGALSPLSLLLSKMCYI